MTNFSSLTSARLSRRANGFSLIELMIAVVIVGVLAAIAYPSYTDSITKTRRRAAEACLSNFATHMERFYTTNLRYNQTSAGVAMDNAALQALALDCASPQNTGAHYNYSFVAVDAASYTLQAVPFGVQAQRDAQCDTLTLDQTGARNASAAGCW
jgi:type IV pilus assembly protein PilE